MKPTRLLLISTVILIAVLTLFFFLEAFSSISPPEDSDQMYTVGVLSVSPGVEPAFEGFKDRMDELDFTEGENIRYVYSGPMAERSDLDVEAKRLVDMQVDLILALGTPAAQAAKDATVVQKIPVVFAPLANPMLSGLVDDLRRPGDNLTGIMSTGSEAKRVEILLEIDPSIKRIYIPHTNLDNVLVGLDALQTGIRELDVELVTASVDDPEEFAAVIETMPADIDAIFTFPEASSVANGERLGEIARERGIPFAVESSFGVDYGVFTYSFDTYRSGRQAARLADQILNGVAPGELPVEVSEFFLTINLIKASEIGLEIPEVVLRRADTIIRE